MDRNICPLCRHLIYFTANIAQEGDNIYLSPVVEDVDVSLLLEKKIVNIDNSHDALYRVVNKEESAAKSKCALIFW